MKSKFNPRNLSRFEIAITVAPLVLGLVILFAETAYPQAEWPHLIMVFFRILFFLWLALVIFMQWRKHRAKSSAE